MKVSKDTKLDPLLLTALESHNPTGAKVHLDDQGVMYWPVIFFYPEYAETDFIHAFNEQNRWESSVFLQFVYVCSFLKKIMPDLHIFVYIGVYDHIYDNTSLWTDFEYVYIFNE